MKRSLILLLLLLLTLSLTVLATEGNVTYSGYSGKVVFAPGSEHSLTDLFPNFKSIMPGDQLTQPITVRNDAGEKVKVKIYLRSLGAHEDSVDFLSQLYLSVQLSAENSMAYMFDPAFASTGGNGTSLSEWVCLGTLYSGGEVNLDVTLSVPVTLDNDYQERIGFLDWEFRIEEYPVDPDDPLPPQTGDESHLVLWSAVAVTSVWLIFLLLFRRRKKKS